MEEEIELPESVPNKYIILMLSCIFGLILVGSSYLHHKIGLDDVNAYTGSFWIPIQMISSMAVFVIAFVSIIKAIISLFKTEWHKIIIYLITLSICFIAWIIASKVDASTLIYMT